MITINRTAMSMLLLAGISVNVVAEPVLEEIVVTVQKRAESLQDVPIAVTAFQDENFGIIDTKSLQIGTPSLIFNNRVTVAQPFIRGIGTTLSLLGMEPNAATCVDDTSFARPIGSIIELPDVLRIEVLKGQQGTSFTQQEVRPLMLVHLARSTTISPDHWMDLSRPVQGLPPGAAKVPLSVILIQLTNSIC